MSVASRHVALLRGINVGGHNMLPMARLRELLDGLGYVGVRTYLQSGNVMFDASGRAPELEAREIEEQIERRLGLRVPVLVRTGEELAEVVAGNPLLDVASVPARLLVTFLSAAPAAELLGGLDPREYEPERFGAGAREIYVWCPEGVRAMKLSYAFWEKRLGVTATARNWNTVTRLLELAEA